MRQLIPWGIDDAPSSSVPQYQTLGGNGEVNAWTSSESEVVMVMPTDGVLSGLSVKADNAPGTGKTMEIIVRVDGADTFGVSLTGTATENTSTGSVAVTKGQTAYLKSKPTNNPSASKMFGSLFFEPANETETIVLGGTGDTNLGSTAKYLPFAGTANGQATASDVQSVVTCTRGGQFGVISSWDIKLQNAPAGTASRTVTLYKNNSIVATVTFTGTEQYKSVPLDIVVGDGDTLYTRFSSQGSPANTKAYWGFVIVPDVTGEYLLFGSSRSTLPTGGTTYEYNRVSTGHTAWTTYKVDKKMGGGTGAKVIGMGMKLSQSPSTTADNKAYELYLENPSSAQNRIYIEGLNTYGNADLDWSTAEYQTFNVRTLGFNSPRPVTACWSLQMTSETT